MRFLADESCDFAAVRALRTAGHDVLAVSEFQQRSVDEELMALALREERALITEDKDFGTLTFASRRESHGVSLLRIPASARTTRIVHRTPCSRIWRTTAGRVHRSTTRRGAHFQAVSSLQSRGATSSQAK